jgi:NADH-quinone oxidoreductase subunit G
MENENITLMIDGNEVVVPKGTTVFEASKKLNIDVPIFCYQDRMPPFGACRVCLVEVEKMGKLQASCTLQATEGMVVHTDSQRAVSGREEILELLLINHPLDCPICDRGGECALQEFALEHGPGESRFFEKKRQFPKAIPLGPVLTLDRERCIVCARCTRFGDIVAGDSALQFIDRGFKTEVGTADGKELESKFIGNTIMICPVGALTSQVYRFRSRPWDNRSNATTCTLCPIGCAMHLDERDGEIQRTRSRTDPEVNDIWLCDKGWFGYEFSESRERLYAPLVKRHGKFEKISWEEALNLIAGLLKNTPADEVAAWGGAPLMTEELYLLQKIMREGLGVPHLDHRIGMSIRPLNEEGRLNGMELSLGDCESLSYFYIIGSDITEEFPVLWLRLKQAMNKGARAIFIGHYAPEVSHLLHEVHLHKPGDELSSLKEHLSKIDTKGKGALFLGSQYLSSGNRAMAIRACEKFCAETQDLSLNLLEGRGNSQGAIWAGMRPDLGPEGAPVKKKGLDPIEVLEHARHSGWSFLYAAACDPASCYPTSLWESARHNIKFLVVQDLFMTETAKQADLILPTLSFLEKKGSMLNVEGRVRQVRKGKLIPEGLMSDGEIFKFLGKKLGLNVEFSPSFADSLNKERIQFPKLKEANSPKTSSSPLSATFAYALFDQGKRMLRNTHLVQLAKAPKVRIHPDEAKKWHCKDGSRVIVSSDEGETEGVLAFDEAVAAGTLVVPLGFTEFSAHELGKKLWNGMPVTLKEVS